MKTGKVAKAFGIDRKTVTNWTDMPQLVKFFSPEAQGIDRTQRDYLEPDLLVINTIRAKRNQSMDWDDIESFLESGDRERELPASAMLVETTAPIAQYGRIVELQTALEAVEEQIEVYQEEMDRLRQEIDKRDREHQLRVDQVREEERQKARLQESEERKTAQEREEKLNKDIIELNRQIARLEVRIEFIQEKDADE
jgi:DNA-binding transcriptional MerR regulator